MNEDQKKQRTKERMWEIFLARISSNVHVFDIHADVIHLVRVWNELENELEKRQKELQNALQHESNNKS